MYAQRLWTEIYKNLQYFQGGHVVKGLATDYKYQVIAQITAKKTNIKLLVHSSLVMINL